MKMEQTFVEGVRFPVTKIALGPCVVTQVKKFEKDGYWAVQLGFGEKKLKNTTKQMKGHLKAVLTEKFSPRYIREIRVDEEPNYSIGDKIKASDIFVVGDIISVTGVSKGKGFAGGVKKWHFRGGPKTHGQSDRWRAPGSIGQGTTPGRVFKGKHMAGRMGNETKTIKNLKVLAIDTEKDQVNLSGPVPGKGGSLLIIKRLNERVEANA